MLEPEKSGNKRHRETCSKHLRWIRILKKLGEQSAVLEKQIYCSDAQHLLFSTYELSISYLSKQILTIQYGQSGVSFYFLYGNKPNNLSDLSGGIYYTITTEVILTHKILTMLHAHTAGNKRNKQMNFDSGHKVRRSYTH